MLYNRLVLASALALVVTVALVLAPSASADVSVGDKAPNFTLGSVDGKSSIKLSDYTNKPTMLAFWVSWCSHCQNEAPVLNKVYDDLKSKGANVVGVSVDNDIEDAKEFVEKYSVTFPNAFAGTDTGAEVIENYGIEGVPATYIIDKDGVVKAIFAGEVNADTLKAEFAKLGVK